MSLAGGTGRAPCASRIMGDFLGEVDLKRAECAPYDSVKEMIEASDAEPRGLTLSPWTRCRIRSGRYRVVRQVKDSVLRVIVVRATATASTYHGRGDGGGWRCTRMG